MVGYKKKYFDLLEKYADKDNKLEPAPDEKGELNKARSKIQNEDEDEVEVEDD